MSFIAELTCVLILLSRYENVAPMEYFRRLVSQFEQSMVEYRQGILSAENHLQVVTNGCPITSSDIVTAVQKLHQALTDLAAKYQVITNQLAITYRIPLTFHSMQVVHTAISQQKYEYLSLQRTLTTSSSTSCKTVDCFPPSDSVPHPVTRARQGK